MSDQRAYRTLIGAVSLILALGPLHAQENGEVELAVEAHGENGGVGLRLFASGSSSTNFLLQSSSNLTEWTNLYHSYGTPSDIPGAGYVYQGHHRQPYVFWRALPGVPLESQKQEWIDNRPTEYTFRLSHLISFWSGGVSGTVRVREGAIVEVTDAVEYLTEEPIENPDLSRFMTIAGIYEEMQRVVDAGAEQVRVDYDEEELYPINITVDWSVGLVDDEAGFEVSDLTIVEP